MAEENVTQLINRLQKLQIELDKAIDTVTQSPIAVVKKLAVAIMQNSIERVRLIKCTETLDDHQKRLLLESFMSMVLIPMADAITVAVDGLVWTPAAINLLAENICLRSYILSVAKTMPDNHVFDMYSARTVNYWVFRLIGDNPDYRFTILGEPGDIRLYLPNLKCAGIG